MKNLYNLLCVFVFIAGLAAEAFPYAWEKYKKLKGKE